MSNITKEQALEALDDLDDCARMDIGVIPTGPYNVLRKFIEQSIEPIGIMERIRLRKIVAKVLRNKGSSKKAKTARGSALKTNTLINYQRLNICQT